MDELSKFCQTIKSKLGIEEKLSIDQAREIIKSINNFLYSNYDGIGKTHALGTSFEYFSEFHRYWEKHHREILNCEIDEDKCKAVAEALHSIFIRTNGNAFRFVYDTCGLEPQDICRVRLLSANQDFRGSRDFSDLATIFDSDNTIFDEENIYNEPEEFVRKLKITNLSQTDKRATYAKNIASFVLKHKCSPVELIEAYHNDIYELRKALINCKSAGYGNKKTDMFLRDMVVLGIWQNVDGFDKIDVASDINTIKVALRTGIIKTEIPLVSSFLDIFCHQYSYIDEMNALAWRRVWEIWHMTYPNETIASPCLIDYFVYRVVGKQFCKKNLYIFECEKEHHYFKWHSNRNKTCQLCHASHRKGVKAHLVMGVMPCNDPEGKISILKSEYVRALPKEQQFGECPFINICGENKKLMPPKSISIMGQTGWNSAYTRQDEGGGGLMA